MKDRSTLPQSDREELAPPRLFDPLASPLRVTDHDWPEGTRPLVSILCPTFNHEKYLDQCLEGFLLQETTFPVEIIIHDDASTDRTPEIANNYATRFPSLIRTILQSENQRSQGKKILPLLLPAALGEFAAICEGDDYWTYSQKLQLQISELERHPHATVCFHAVQVIDNDATRPVSWEVRWNTSEVKTADLLDFNMIQTCSAMFRKKAALVPQKLLQDIYMADWPTWIFASRIGPIRYIPKNMAVYRKHSQGIWSSKPLAWRQLESARMLLKIAPYFEKELKPSIQKQIFKRYVDATSLLALTNSSNTTPHNDEDITLFVSSLTEKGKRSFFSSVLKSLETPLYDEFTDGALTNSYIYNSLLNIFELHIRRRTIDRLIRHALAEAASTSANTLYKNNRFQESLSHFKIAISLRKSSLKNLIYYLLAFLGKSGKWIRNFAKVFSHALRIR